MSTDIVMVPVTEILQTIWSSCDFWYIDPDDDDARTALLQEIMRSKSLDTGFGHLVESILTNGWDPDSAIGWADGHMSQGHHRFVAAILLGMDEVPTTSWGQDSGFNSKGKTGYLSASRNDDDPYPIDVAA